MGFLSVELSDKPRFYVQGTCTEDILANTVAAYITLSSSGPPYSSRTCHVSPEDEVHYIPPYFCRRTKKKEKKRKKGLRRKV